MLEEFLDKFGDNRLVSLSDEDSIGAERYASSVDEVRYISVTTLKGGQSSSRECIYKGSGELSRTSSSLVKFLIY